MYVHAGGETPQAYAQSWLQAKQEGWTGCKAEFLTTQGTTIDPIRSVRDGIARLKAVRDSVGEDFRICIDLHGKATPTMALDFCRRAEEYSPFFVEEARSSKIWTNWLCCAARRAFPWPPASV